MFPRAGSAGTMDELLDRLVGRWSLRGRMGHAELHQEVKARWILKGLFVEMRFESVRIGEGGNPDYEAVYLMGRDEARDAYVLHLFDTAGVSARPVPGIGIREGDSIRFRFDYDGGPWFNTFTWLPARGSWKNVITHDEGGRTVTFAEKELTPAP